MLWANLTGSNTSSCTGRNVSAAPSTITVAPLDLRGRGFRRAERWSRRNCLERLIGWVPDDQCSQGTAWWHDPGLAKDGPTRQISRPRHTIRFGKGFVTPTWSGRDAVS
ncbi:hypothetical protein JJ691_22560 [Kutzneria sp. CA-103260]|nr:hypothetical protein JJ691_22560 [Kutzneria sp. CA-103260]